MGHFAITKVLFFEYNFTKYVFQWKILFFFFVFKNVNNDL